MPFTLVSMSFYGIECCRFLLSLCDACMFFRLAGCPHFFCHKLVKQVTVLPTRYNTQTSISKVWSGNCDPASFLMTLGCDQNPRTV